MLKQWNNIAQKHDFNSFISATITIFSVANPARVARRWIAKDIWSLSSQLGRTFHAMHYFAHNKTSNVSSKFAVCHFEIPSFPEIGWLFLFILVHERTDRNNSWLWNFIRQTHKNSTLANKNAPLIQQFTNADFVKIFPAANCYQLASFYCCKNLKRLTTTEAIP